jgi:hypothetical protein
MDATMLIMWGGFLLSAYAVVGNDSIQTLGTFLTSNEDKPWWMLWAFAGSILTATLVYGWITHGGDVSYGRLLVSSKLDSNALRYPNPMDIEGFSWPYILPPLVLMLLTRTGIPVSTSFLILTFFAPKGVYDMISKSLLGYVLAFIVAIVLYTVISRTLEKKFITTPLKPDSKKLWTVLQWGSTGFLWSMWLIQDFANIYVLLAMLAYIFANRGGSIQEIVRAKLNTQDIRSATIIDFTYGLLLLFFKEYNDIPMSTTWVFLGLLAGREIAIRWRLGDRNDTNDYLDADEPGFALDADQNIHPMSLGKDTWKMVGTDLWKVFLGLAISVGLVFVMQALTGKGGF